MALGETQTPPFVFCWEDLNIDGIIYGVGFVLSHSRFVEHAGSEAAASNHSRAHQQDRRAQAGSDARSTPGSKRSRKNESELEDSEDEKEELDEPQKKKSKPAEVVDDAPIVYTKFE